MGFQLQTLANEATEDVRGDTENDYLNSFPIKLFSPESSIFEHNANNLIRLKKSRKKAMFNPFERRPWEYQRKYFSSRNTLKAFLPIATPFLRIPKRKVIYHYQGIFDFKWEKIYI